MALPGIPNSKNNAACDKCNLWGKKETQIQCKGNHLGCSNKFLHPGCAQAGHNGEQLLCSTCFDCEKMNEPPIKQQSSTKYDPPGVNWKKRNIWKVYLLHQLVIRATLYHGESRLKMETSLRLVKPRKQYLLLSLVDFTNWLMESNSMTFISTSQHG